MADLSINNQPQAQKMKFENNTVETGGVVAYQGAGTNTASPLFNAASSSETAGSIASSAGSSSGGGLNVNC